MMKFVLKKPCQQLKLAAPTALHSAFPKPFRRLECCLAPSQQSSPQAIYLHRFLSVQHAVSRLSSMLSRSFPAKLSASYFHGFLSVQHAVSLPPSEALRKLFPWFPFRPACCIASSQRSSPQAISTVSFPSSMLSRSLPAKLSTSYFHGFPPSSMLCRSLPAELSASYFHGVLFVQHAVSLPPSEALRKLLPRFPLRPACCIGLYRSLPAELPQRYLHDSLSVQHAVSLRPSEALRKLFLWFPLLYRSLPAKLSESYFHGFLSFQHAVSLPAKLSASSRFPFHPACCLAPSRRSSPQAISMVSSPSSMLYRSLLFPRFPLRPACCISLLPSEALASYFHGFLSVQHAVSLPPSEALRKLFPRFPLRPACCLAPSPQAISMVSSPSSMLYRSFPAKLSASYFHGFLSIACCLAPSRRSSPQAIDTVSSPSSMHYRSLPAELSESYLHDFSMLSRSLPAKLPASYFHGFLSVQHAVSLPPS